MATHEPAVVRFNRRLSMGGVAPDLFLSETAVPSWLGADGGPLFQEQFVAWDGEEVRGGYVLKHQMFRVMKRVESVGFFHAPVSEALVDKRWSMLGATFLRDALKRQPLLYCLGMGGVEQPLPRILSALGWSITLVPFAFMLARPAACLQELAAIRQRPLARVIRPLLRNALGNASSGWLLRAVASYRAPAARWTSRHASSRRAIARDFPEWADSADDAPAHRFAAVRDRLTLNRLYPPESVRFLKLRVETSDGSCLGWAVLLNTQMENHRHFGNLRVGSIIDANARAGTELLVLQSAVAELRDREVDIIVANFSADEWQAAAMSAGMMLGPSNFALACSKALTARIGDVSKLRSYVHVTRGDGDGPINL